MTIEYIDYIKEMKQQGKSFEDISELLLKEFGLKVSRQAVCKCYNAHAKDKEKVRYGLNECTYAE